MLQFIRSQRVKHDLATEQQEVYLGCLHVFLFVFILFFFYIFCSMAMISTILSSRSFICTSASLILLLIPSSVLFISVCLFLSSCRSLVNISYNLLSLCLHSVSEMLNHIYYHYSEFFFWKVAYLHFIKLFFLGFYLVPSSGMQLSAFSC